MSYNRILVPFDGSALSQTALEVGVATAAWSGAELVLMYIERESVDLEDGGATNDLDVIEREADALLAHARPLMDKHGVDMSKVKADVRAGPVAEVIGNVVEELLCDLIVMATHGRKGLLEALTGSTTERVLRNTPASVFVVRPKGYPYLRD